ncbi:serine/threonine-protein kinase [Streptomyces globosus]|uniref:serine/threonine-protein kinase n=1 Tax=Streptomyces globosus TaxID=68209 RepID=UPI0038103F27
MGRWPEDEGERVALEDGPDDGGTVIGGRYRLGGRLGRGGMGVVWRATDELLGRAVAVKALSLDAGADPAGALREARAVAKVRHPHVVVVHDVVEHEGRPVIVMELVDGGSLADRLAGPDGPMAPREAAAVGLALLDALTAAHALGVQHRDVKPANVLLEAGTGRAVLTDFGIASLPGATTISEAGAFAGTPEYAAPERMQGGAGGPASDLWSLGALLCAAVTGESPFRRDSIGAVLHAVVYEEVRPSQRLGPLLPVVRGLLERDPDRRLGAARARRMLVACAAGDGVADAATADAAAVAAPGPGAGADAGPDPAAGAAYTPTEHGGGRPGAAPAPAAVREGGTEPRTRDGGGPPARPRLRGARAALVVAGAVAACAGAVTAVALLDGRTQPPPAAAGTAAAPAAPGPSAAAPTAPPPPAAAPSPSATTAPAPATTTAAPPPSPPADARPVPRGYVLVTDERGFSLAVPQGTRRSTDGERVFYTTADGAVRVGIRTGPVPAGGALGSMRAADARGPESNPGYRDNAVTPTTHDGLPAALWEFTWNGFTAAEGPRHTYDICWEQAGTLHDVWVSAPTGRTKEARAVFDTAVDSYLPAGG